MRLFHSRYIKSVLYLWSVNTFKKNIPLLLLHFNELFAECLLVVKETFKVSDDIFILHVNLSLYQKAGSVH